MQGIFLGASSFNQSLENWSLNLNVNLTNALDNSGIDCMNYSSTLTGWAANTNTPGKRALGASGIFYGTNVVADRNYLINTKGWIINGDMMSSGICCLPSSSTISQTACDSFVFNGQSLTTNGIYYDTLINSNGCDSILTLNLTITNIINTVSLNGTSITAIENGATYQWLACPNYTIIPGATNQSFNATNNGDYAVSIIKNNCIDTSNCVTVTGVGINNISALTDIWIRPNPTKGFINISSQNVHNHSSINIINSLGQIIITKESNAINDNIDISAFANGMYYIEIIADNKTYRTKIVKN